MARSGSGPTDFWEPLVGLALVIVGIASVGALVVAAGGGHASPALVLTAVAVLLLGAGVATITHSGRHDGGMRGPHLDAEQRRRYRAEFRRWRTRR
jgi:predicted benzoate:H+ symporter BenE